MTTCSSVPAIPLDTNIVCQLAVNFEPMASPIVTTAAVEIADTISHVIITLVSLLGLLVFFIFMIVMSVFIYMGQLSAPAGILVIVVGLVIVAAFCVGILLVIRNAVSSSVESVKTMVQSFKTLVNDPDFIKKLLGAQ